METVNWMYLLDPDGMLKLLELVNISSIQFSCNAKHIMKNTQKGMMHTLTPAGHLKITQ